MSLSGALYAAAERRVALVIGNDNYQNLPKLEKAVNDANSVAAELKKVGFNKENVGILESVTELLIPRMIDRQSLTVDAICGATASRTAGASPLWTSWSAAWRRARLSASCPGLSSTAT